MKKAFDWDSELTPENANFRHALPAGSYPFRVIGLERKESSLNGNKYADLTIELDGGALGKSHCRDWLVLGERTVWRVCAFMVAIGQMKHGQPCKPDWEAVVGATGLCEVKPEGIYQEDGSDGQRNRVTIYLPPETTASSDTAA